jgi:hypothetical protein
MLPKEKRRVGWSIAIGAIVAGSVAGSYYLRAFNANRRLRTLVAECQERVKSWPSVPEGYVAASACDPEFLVELHGLPNVDQAKIRTRRGKPTATERTAVA